MKTLYLFFTLYLFIFTNSLPIAVIHGFKQKCSNQDFKDLVSYFQEHTKNYVKCIETGGGTKDINTPFREQAKKACELINSDENYQNDFTLFSISQGGLIARYIIEKCEMKGTVKTFVAMGGPLAGTHHFPFCHKGVICHIMNSVIDWLVYKNYVQNSIGPAGYFRVSNHLKNYYKSKSFLLEINNEKNYDENAKKRFLKLDKLVLIAFIKDRLISPRESAHFCNYDEKHKLVDMKDTKIYKEDLFGLKTLDEQGKITKLWVNNEHCIYEWSDIDETVIPYL